MSVPYKEPRCKICVSSNRLVYERLYKDEHKSWLDLSEIAKTQFTEDLSHMAFYRHMTKHFSAIVEKFIKVDTSARETIDKEVSKTLDILKEYQENVKMLKDWIGSFKDMDKTPESVRALTQLLGEQRETLTMCEKLTEKLESKRSAISEPELVREMVYASEGLCDKCKEEMVNKLEKRVRALEQHESSKTSDQNP